MLICLGEGGGVTEEDDVGEVGEQGERAQHLQEQAGKS